MPEWLISELRQLASIRKGKKVPTSDEAQVGFQPYLGASALLGGFDGYADPAHGVTANERDVLMLWDGERSGLVGTRLTGVVSSTVARLTPKTMVRPEYLYFALAQRFEWIQSQRTGSGVPHVPKDLGAKLSIAHPIDENEQQSIVDVLFTMDELIASAHTSMAKLRQLKLGVMRDVLTRGVTLAGRLRPTRAEAPHLYKESSLGWLPASWDAEVLDQVAVRGSGHTPSKNEPSFWNGGVKWISLADTFRLDRVYITETEKTISIAGIANSSAVLHPPGVVVLSRDAGVGKSAITTEPMAVSQHFICWRCSARLNNVYLYYWLQNEKRHFENIATGTTIPTIGLGFFKRYRVAVPRDVREQVRIATALLAIDNQLWERERELDKLQSLRKGLMEDLLTGRVPIRRD